VGDTALVGSAVIAARGVGLLSDCRPAVRKTIREEAPIRCDQERHEQYKPMIRKYLKIIDALSGV
jgi:sugar (pentulose or hexulose) kinase